MPGNCNFCIWSDIVASQNKNNKTPDIYGIFNGRGQRGDLKGESG